MYFVLQYTKNIISNQYPDDAWIEKEQGLVIEKITYFINRATGKDHSGSFTYDYPSWCENVFKQKLLNITSLDGRNMKYQLNQKNSQVNLSESYVGNEVCEKFKISLVDSENDEGIWRLLTQFNDSFDSSTGLGKKDNAGIQHFLSVADNPEEFIIKYDGKVIVIHIIENNKASGKHLGAQGSGARSVFVTTHKSYEWKIVSN